MHNDASFSKFLLGHLLSARMNDVTTDKEGETSRIVATLYKWMLHL